jgi:hypothetical protein
MDSGARRCLLTVLTIVTLTAGGICAADLLTPGGTRPAGDEAPVLGDIVPLDLDEVAGEILETYSFSLGRYDDVVFGAEQWKGPQDASLNCNVSLTPTAIYLEGEFIDDYPFCQRTLHPARPAWWNVGYGADGVVVSFEDPTSASQKVAFALNWGSRAGAPRVDIIQSMLGTPPAFSRGGCVQLEDAAQADRRAESKTPPGAAVQFRAGVPITELADPQFFARPLQLTVELYDVDGEYVSVSVLRGSVRTRKAPGATR